MAQLKPADLASEVHRLGVENQQLILRVNGLEAQLHGLRQEVLMLRGTQNPLQMGPNTSQPPHLALPGFAPPGYAMTTHHQGQVPNARFLPFVLEDIAAAKRRIKGQTGMQQW